MMKYLFILWVTMFVFFPNSVFSQAKIKGVISENNGEPIYYATITLLNKSDSTVVSYDFSNDDGTYSITVNEKGDYIVRVTYLGFELQDKNVLIQNQEVINLDFKLENSQISLEEIVVNGRRIGIQYSNDTVSYDPRAFRDGTENSLGDVLNKLPGIQIDDKGNIRAHGKRVNKVLLNGQDFFGSNTQVATQNLSADIADKINVLNNYSEYSLLGGFQSKEQTVINVDVNEKWYGKLSGELTASGGIEDRYDTKGNLININAKSMFSLLFSQNNTGNEVFNMEDYFRLQGGLNEILESGENGKIELSEDEERMLMPSKNMKSRTNGLLALNYTFQPNDKLKLHSYVLTNRNKEISTDYNKYTYNISGNNLFNNIEDVSKKNKAELYNAFLKLDYSINKGLSVHYKGSSSFSNNKQNNNVLNLMNEDQIFSSELRKNKPFKLSNSLALIKSFNKHLFITELNLHYYNTPSHYYLETDSLLLPIPTTISEGFFRVNQNIKEKTLSGKLSASFLYRIDESSFVQAKLGYNIYSQKYSSGVDPLAPDYLNDLSLKETDCRLSADWNKNKGLLQFKLGLSADVYRFNHKPQARKSNLFRLNPYANISFVFTDKHKLNLSFKKSIEPNHLTSFITNNLIRDYRTYEGISLFDKSYFSDYNSNLIYNFFELYSNTMLVVFANYNKRKNTNTKNIMQKSSLTYWENVSSPDTETFYTNLTLSKGLGFISWVADIKSSYMRNKHYNYISSNENKIKTDIWGASLILRSKYKSAFNTELISKIEGVKSNPSLSGKVSQNTQTYGLKVVYTPISKLLMDIEYNYVFNRSSYGEKQNLHIVRGNISYRFNKNIDISLVGNNILNLHKLQWNSLNYENNYTVEKQFQQIPGNIMLRLKYKL